MKNIEIIFVNNTAVITETTETEFTVRRMKAVSALVWMSRQGKKWVWDKTEDGLERATWSRG